MREHLQCAFFSFISNAKINHKSMNFYKKGVKSLNEITVLPKEWRLSLLKKGVKQMKEYKATDPEMIQAQKDVAEMSNFLKARSIRKRSLLI